MRVADDEDVMNSVCERERHLMGDENQICLLGTCLLITYVPCSIGWFCRGGG